jgi:hypothetical protein
LTASRQTADVAGLEQIDGESRRAGRVIQLPTLVQAEAAVAEIVSGSEPSTFEERRHVLEGIQDLKMFYDQGFMEIHWKIPALRKSIHGISRQVDRLWLAAPHTRSDIDRFQHG